MAVMKMVFFRTAWSQDGDNPVGLRGSVRTGERRGYLLLLHERQTITHSPRARSLLLLSSGVTLDVVVHFIPEVLLVPQMMLCSFDIQWIIKIQKISK